MAYDTPRSLGPGPARSAGPAEGARPDTARGTVLGTAPLRQPMDGFAGRPTHSGQEGFDAVTAVTVTLLSHSASTPSSRASWVAPLPGRPTTRVGYETGAAPDTQ